MQPGRPRPRPGGSADRHESRLPDHVRPGKEPLSMVTKTWRRPYDCAPGFCTSGCSTRRRSRGEAVCERLGVHHFTRKDVPEWNRPKGPHAPGQAPATTTPGSSARRRLRLLRLRRHRPRSAAQLPGAMLGFFARPGRGLRHRPQVYGNYDTFVTKAAESQAVLFHALIQGRQPLRLPMFVGTSTAVRISALKQAAACTTRSPRTWRPASRSTATGTPPPGGSGGLVYTPDVLAVGEGPGAWTDFFHPAAALVAGHVRDDLKQYWKASSHCPLASSSTTR